MAFMQKEVTREMMWVELDGSMGTQFVAMEDLGAKQAEFASNFAGDDRSSDELTEIFEGVYAGNSVESVSLRMGFGARLSAPGYLDCTEWSVYDTVEEAEQSLVDDYGADEDAEEDSADEDGGDDDGTETVHYLDADGKLRDTNTDAEEDGAEMFCDGCQAPNIGAGYFQHEAGCIHADKRWNDSTATWEDAGDTLHVFTPDHNLVCELCGAGELVGNHGMIPGDGGASGTDYSPQYQNDSVRAMYDAALHLTDHEDSQPDHLLRAELAKPAELPALRSIILDAIAAAYSTTVEAIEADIAEAGGAYENLAYFVDAMDARGY